MWLLIWQLGRWKQLVDEIGQQRMARLVSADRNATVTQITTVYNCGEWKITSECTTRHNLRRMGCNSRRPPWVPRLSAKNRKMRQQWTQAHQNWTVRLEIRSLGWWFLLRYTDGRVRLWHQQHESMESMDPWVNSPGWWWWCNGLHHHHQLVTSDRGTRCRPGWMQKSLFIQKQSREPGDQKFEVQNDRQRVVNQNA